MTNFFIKWRNRLIAFIFDIGMIPVAWFGSYWVSFDLHRIPDDMLQGAAFLFIPLFLLQMTAFWMFGLYRGVWRFASIPDLIRITKAVIVGTISTLLVFYFAKSSFEFPRVVPVLYGLILGAGLAGARGLFRWLKDYRLFFSDSKRVLIVGGGNAGEGLVRDLIRKNNLFFRPVAIVDDGSAKQGRDIHGIRIVGTCEKIPEIVKNYDIDVIFITIPSATSAQMRRVVSICEQCNVAFRTLPSINDLAEGRIDIKLLRDVSLEDLLGRDQVNLDWHQIGKDIHQKTILVSGGGGSIGSELCRQIASLGPKQLIVVDHSEYNLYLIDMELRKKFPHLIFHSVLLNITDKVGINRIFSTYHPDLVFHAAAYKHVPLLENQARVAIYNNILGTYILAHAAVEHHVYKFVLISTDKAVNPANLMGATKRAAEMICQNLHEQSTTAFITVRFGNVLDSAGSVVPLFRKQIQDGGPVTVTHPDITRYFMSIPEASQLILQAALLGNGGEIFVLDMGEPIKVRYLAEQMIKFAGKTLGQDIDIIYTGLRPGEKLYEELFYENEKLQPTMHHKIMQAKSHKVDKGLVVSLLSAMEKAHHHGDERGLYELLSQLVPEYNIKFNSYFDKEEIDNAHGHLVNFYRQPLIETLLN